MTRINESNGTVLFCDSCLGKVFFSGIDFGRCYKTVNGRGDN